MKNNTILLALLKHFTLNTGFYFFPALTSCHRSGIILERFWGFSALKIMSLTMSTLLGSQLLGPEGDKAKILNMPVPVSDQEREIIKRIGEDRHDGSGSP